jgi:hypothetical protein
MCARVRMNWIGSYPRPTMTQVVTKKVAFSSSSQISNRLCKKTNWKFNKNRTHVLLRRWFLLFSLPRQRHPSCVLRKNKSYSVAYCSVLRKKNTHTHRPLEWSHNPMRCMIYLNHLSLNSRHHHRVARAVNYSKTKQLTTHHHNYK